MTNHHGKDRIARHLDRTILNPALSSNRKLASMLTLQENRVIQNYPFPRSTGSVDGLWTFEKGAKMIRPSL